MKFPITLNIFLLKKIARLEEKNIFVSEADLMNLWFLLSKEKKKQQDSTDSGSLGSVTNQKDGLNAVVDLLLQPNGEQKVPV